MRKSYLILFLLLTVSFSLEAQTIWDGPVITFTKADYADWTQVENQDRINDDVWITRQNNRSIFNIVAETESPSGCSSTAPSGTQWALGTTSAGIENLTFETFYDVHDCNPESILNSDMVLRLVDTNTYIDIKFLSWTSGEGAGGGGFSYQRSTPPLQLKGIIDIDGGFKKGVHVQATADIADLSIYKLQVYSNANTTAGASYTLSGSATAGDHILIANDGDALDSYMSASTIFNTVFNTGTFPSINGDDTVELLMNDNSIEVFGDIGTDGTGQVWEYTDSWAYKDDGEWTYGGVNCSDGTTTTWDSSCVYPLAVGQEPVSYNVTFNVDMTNENVSANGVYVGGGFLGGADAYQMLDEDGDNIYSVTIGINEGAGGNYVFLNGPANAADWGTKEDLAGQSCADGQYNDRLLPPVTEDTSVLFCFGTCEATCPADPCADVVGAPEISDDFDGNSVDILEYFDDALTTTVVDGTSIGGSGNVLQYVDDGSGFYANVQLRTCNKFDMSLTNYFTLDVYLDSSTITGTSPNQVQFKLQNGDLGAPWETQVVATATVDQLDTWQTLVFDFNLVAGALDRTDIDNVVIQVNGEANNDPVTAYIDNITSGAGAPATNYNVTFEVDANNIIVGDRGMFVGGGFLGGADAYAMADADGDGIWTVTVELPEGTSGNWAFFNAPGDGGDWNRKENLAGLSCADAANFNDRYLDAITGDTTISYCFATCEASCTPVTRYDVTFEVGMANETVTGGVYLAGGIFGGSNAIQMFDADGDGIYTKVVSIPENTTGHYAFTNSPNSHFDWGTKENLAGLECGDPANYNDRQIGPITAETTFSFCFGSCEAASACAFGPCDSAIALTPGTTQTGNTSDFGDLFDDSPCLGSYDGGDDALYVYTATEDGETLEINLSGQASWTGIAVSQGCPTAGEGVCVGSQTSSSNGPLSFITDPLVAGEDYYVHISTWPSPQSTAYVLDATVIAAPSCLDPTAVAVSDVLTTTATVSWTSNDVNFNIEYGPSGFTLGSGTSATSTATTYALTGLTSATSYDVYVQADCGAGDTSEWVLVSFATNPACGDTVTDSGGATGDYGVNELTTVTAYPDNAGDLVTFTFISFATESCCDDLTVYDGPDTNSPVVGVYAGTTIPDPITSTHATGALTFVFDSDGSVQDSGYEIAISCNPPPACLEPTAITATDVTTTSADISWTAGDSETAWNIEWGEAGFTLGEGTSDATTSPAYSLSGLTPNQTGYDFYVQADCGDGTSEWAGPFTFYTACDVFPGAWSNDFETDALCWNVVNGGDANGWGLYTNTTDGGGAVSWGIQYSSTAAHDDYLISPAYSVVDGVSDRFTFDARNGLSSYPEMMDVQVWDAGLTTMLGTLATGVTPGTAFETFSYDLSTYEGQDVRVAFYIATTDMYYMFVDNVVVDATLGIDDESMISFNYFPNPVNDVLTIKAQNNVEDIKVFNMLGQMVLRQTPDMRDCQVDLSAMQSGAYFVQVSIGNTVETVRVLKK